MSNTVQGFFVTIQDPNNEESYIDLYLHHNHPIQKSVEIINNTPYIIVDCKFDGNIYSIKDNTNYIDDTFLSSVSSEASKYIELQISNYLYRTAKEYKSDISGFGNNALKNFLTINDFESYNWKDNYQDAFFKVNCDVSIKSGNLITEI